MKGKVVFFTLALGAELVPKIIKKQFAYEVAFASLKLMVDIRKDLNVQELFAFQNGEKRD